MVTAVEISTNTPDGRLWRSRRFQAWLNRRMPASDSITLSQKSIFILPTGQGIIFVLLIVFMMLAGINYQNSLIFALAFLLISMFMVSILHTYRNLSGLTIQAGRSEPAFAGEDAEFDVILCRQGKRTHEALVLGWNPDLMQGADLLENVEVRVKLFVETKVRGLLAPGRLLIQTLYPVGLFRAWSWVDLDMSTIVYPCPIHAGEIPDAVSTTDEGELLQRQGVDDFHGLRQYQDGDSLRQIAWKSFARTNDLLTKEFAAYVDRRVWLDWAFFHGLDREKRLSRLCFWVIEMSKTSDAYGLRLPGIEIQPDSGPEHRRRLLRELAIFEANV